MNIRFFAKWPSLVVIGLLSAAALASGCSSDDPGQTLTNKGDGGTKKGTDGGDPGPGSDSGPGPGPEPGLDGGTETGTGEDGGNPTSEGGAEAGTEGGSLMAFGQGPCSQGSQCQSGVCFV